MITDDRVTDAHAAMLESAGVTLIVAPAGADEEEADAG